MLRSSRAAAWLSAVIYTGLALGLALAFAILSPRPAPEDAVARFGGAAWVFLLAMIILMPTFAPLLRRWLTRAPGRPQHTSAGPIGTPAAATGAESARDPVCGMVIPTASAAGTSQHAGRTVYFCSLSCKGRFDGAPGQFPSD